MRRTRRSDATPCKGVTQRPGKCARVLCRGGLVGVALCLIVFRHSVRPDWDGLLSKPSVVETSPRTADSDLTFGNRRICPNTRNILNLQNLESAFLQAENFHYGGGALKSVETLLNSVVDDAYRKSGAKFTPLGSDTPVPANASISAAMKKSLVENDKYKRGGYDQRQTPGRMELDNDILIIGKRHIVDVVEPLDQKRWEYGLGPVHRSICKRVDIIKSNQKRRKSYDDKFMCSYDQLLKHSKTNPDPTNQQQSNKRSLLRNTNHAASHHEELQSDHHHQQRCEMISIGSNGQWGFEEEIHRSTNCTTHTFDCTVSNNPNKPNIDSIHFYPFCVSSKNQVIDGREYMAYSKMIEKTGMTEPPTLFKMDVEGFEYDVMAQMLDEAENNDKMHMLPSQISVELHYATRMYDVPWMSRTVTTAEIAMFVGMMFRKGGYIISHHEPIGPGCHACAEVLFVRTFC